MTDEQIYRELCALDPALTEQQKHLHDWDCEAWTEIESKRGRFEFICRELDCSARESVVAMDEESARCFLTEFGDGDTSRYSTVDALFALADRLEARVMIDTKFGWDIDQHKPLCQAAVWHEGNPMEQAIEINRVAAAGQALLRAFGRWVDSAETEVSK